MRTSCSFSERRPCIVCNDSSPELARCACLFRSSASPSDADVEGGQAGLGDDSHGALPVPLISTPGEPIGITTLEDVMEELIQVRAEDTELLTPACGCNTVSGSPRLPHPLLASSPLLLQFEIVDETDKVRYDFWGNEASGRFAVLPHMPVH